jgi:hypothetical protein
MALARPIYCYLLLCGIILFLFIPQIQSRFNIKKHIRPLKGAYINAEDVEFSRENWFNSAFQNKKEKFVEQNFGFRNYYVLLNNQVDYSLFRKANVEKVVVGKGGFLYEANYIDAYFGNNFAGEEKLEAHFKKIKDLQDLLKEKGICLEVVFAPGKASYYPEFIPDSWRSEKKLNNYEYCASLCRKLDIRHMDLNAWFMNQKDYTPYDLYPKTGIHWSNYGSLIAFDSLTKHLEHYTKLNLKTFTVANVSFSDSLRSPDDDIGSAMNLIWKVQPFPMPYANYHWTDDTTFVRPPALFIGDSYFWNIYYEGLTNNVFSDCKFWYYAKEVYPESEPERNAEKLNILDEIKKQKIIVLMATECNIHDLGWSFIDRAIDAFKFEMKSVFRKNVYVLNIIDEIRKTPKWLAEIEKKAKQDRRTLEEQIKLDAQYVYDTDYGRPEVVAITEDVKVRIGNTPEWQEQIKKKAAEKGISIEEMTELDAKYIYVTEYQGKMNK